KTTAPARRCRRRAAEVPPGALFAWPWQILVRALPRVKGMALETVRPRSALRMMALPAISYFWHEDISRLGAGGCLRMTIQTVHPAMAVMAKFACPDPAPGNSWLAIIRQSFGSPDWLGFHLLVAAAAAVCAVKE